MEKGRIQRILLMTDDCLWGIAKEFQETRRWDQKKELNVWFREIRSYKQVEI